VKLAATRDLGAEIVLYDRYTESREEIAAALCAKTGATLVQAFADPWVIAGQGTIGSELFAQGGTPMRIVAPCGGGGLSAGLALACPGPKLVQVEPEGWNDVRRSLEAGEIVSVEPNPPPTACDALPPLQTQPVNFAVLKERCPYGLMVAPPKCRRRSGAGEQGPARRAHGRSAFRRQH
jgi:threonine dehydratase